MALPEAMYEESKSAGAAEAAASRENSWTSSRWVGGDVREAAAVAEDVGLLCQPAPRTPREACPMALLTARTRGGGRPARVSGCGMHCRHGAQGCCTRGRWAGAKGPICRLLQIRGHAYPQTHESAQEFGLVVEGEKPPSGCGRRGRSSSDYREHGGGRARRRAAIYRRWTVSDLSHAIHQLQADHV